jgi:hypothetical protein
VGVGHGRRIILHIGQANGRRFDTDLHDRRGSFDRLRMRKSVPASAPMDASFSSC